MIAEAKAGPSVHSGERQEPTNTRNPIAESPIRQKQTLTGVARSAFVTGQTVQYHRRFDMKTFLKSDKRHLTWLAAVVV